MTTDDTVLVANVVVRNQAGQVLLIRRSQTHPRLSLMWDLPGGLVEPGEAPEEAAERETWEETGLTVHDLEKYRERDAERDGRSYKFVLFTAMTDSDEVELSYEHDQYRWITAADIPELDLPERMREVLLRLTAAQ